jgi:hypothetical protein
MKYPIWGTQLFYIVLTIPRSAASDLQFHPEEVLVEVTLQNLIAEVDKKLPQRCMFQGCNNNKVPTPKENRPVSFFI